jgi:hypothetical protein
MARSYLLFVFLISLSLSACGLPIGGATVPTAAQSGPTEASVGATSRPPTAASEQTAPPQDTVAATEAPTGGETQTAMPALPSPTAEATAPATASPPAELDDLSLSADAISLFPVPALYAGDLASIKVTPHLPAGLAPNDVDVSIFVDDWEIVAGNLDERNLDGDSFGLYEWVWQTDGQQGTHTVTVILDPQDLIQIGDENPDNNVAAITVVVRPRSELPAVAANAYWFTSETGCCFVHVVSGTAAHRDVSQLLPKVAAAFDEASSKLEVPIRERYQVFFADRVIGQGGYAIDSMVISYLDRDYVGGGLEEVLAHEAVHLLDKQFAPERITFLSEGLAVWVAGGHYKQEDVDQRMAALVELGRQVPLAQAIDDFYAMQHETSYLEAASFMSYLINTYGWRAVRTFYSSASADDAATLSLAVDLNLQAYFNRTLEQTESDWMAYLRELPRDRAAAQNLQATIRFFNMVRRYQKAYDPTAHYLSAWLLSPEEALELGATADLSRHPASETNVALEAMLQAAGEALEDQDYESMNALVSSVGRVLSNNGEFIDPLASSYLEIVRSAEEMGYQVQQIDLSGNRATALASQPQWPDLLQLQLVLERDRSWTLR